MFLNVEDVTEDQLPRLSTVFFRVEKSTAEDEQQLAASFESATHQRPFMAELIAGECLCEMHKKILKLTVKVEGWLSEPGDALHLLPENDPDEVELIVKRLGLGLEQVFKFDCPTAGPESLGAALHGRSLKVRTLFSRFVDLNAFPKKACLRHWAEYCIDAEARRAMLWLSSKLGSAAYLQLAGQHTRLLDFLISLFPTCLPPLEVFLTHATLLAARPYSVASSSLERGQEADLCLALMTYQSADHSPRMGVASAWLERITGGLERADGLVKYRQERLLVYPRPSNGFRLPSNLSRPLIMVGSGTGVAPFLGMLKHRRAIKTNLGPCWLFYGFRSRDHDFLFEQDLAQLQQEGILTELIVAVSRDPIKPAYVQDCLAERRDWVYRLLTEQNGALLLCGDELTMIKSVNDFLQALIMEKESLDAKAASLQLLAWSKAGRIIRDVWV